MNAARGGHVLTPARRRVLQAVGLLVSFPLAGCGLLPPIPRRPKAAFAGALGWVHAADGRFTLHLPRVEMGQGIATALKQIACEELAIGWEQLAVHAHGTDSIAPVRATVGSESIRDFALPMAQACATLREALAQGRTAGALAAEPRPAAELRAFRRGGRFVGGVPPLEQGRAIVCGEPLYAADVRRPGMVYGRVLRAPVSPELASRALAWDAAAARAVPGFVALVAGEEGLLQAASQGLGIVAETPAALDRVEQALAPRWQADGSFDAADIDAAIDIDRRIAAHGPRRGHWDSFALEGLRYERLGAARRAHAVHDDPIDAAARWDVDLRIDVPLAAHGAIEPRAAVAEFDTAAGTLRLWVGSQDVFYVRDVVARRLGLDAARVVVQGCRVGGAFGGRTICTVELEAAVLARAAARPVKVQWSRAQEARQGFHRPPSSHRVRARLAQGRIVEWQHQFASSHILFTNAVLPPWLQRLTGLAGDDGVARGAALPYSVARRQTRFDLVRLPVFTGPWRGLGAGPNGLVVESAIDEAAWVAGADPLAFRLAHLQHAEGARLARCLGRAAQAAGWRGRAPRREGAQRSARGVACGIYKGSSFAAVVADVTVDATSGEVRVTRLVCAHDCGFVVNPDQVRAQCEGNLVWGLGMALFDTLPVAGSQVAANGFADAPIPRLADVPALDVVLIDEGEAPGGAGETAIVAAAAAIINALRAASGVRPARLPVSAAALREAMAG